MNNFDFSLLRGLSKETDSKHHARWSESNSENGHRKSYYIHQISAFDIETSLIHTKEENPEAIMYIWMFHIESIGTYYGRTWESFIDFIESLIANIPKKTTLIIWVHNLAYEWQFIRHLFEWEKVFLLDKRKPLTAKYKGIEFRCSYRQTNMSLDAFTTKMDVEHKKLSGEEFDYKKVRYPWTLLTDKELQYCENDVIGLCEAIRKQMEMDEDSLYSIPLTSTGYVRRDVRKATQYFRKILQPLYPDDELYKVLHDAFRGGDVHANPNYAGQILKNVKSVDKSSAYPSVQVLNKFPMSKFNKYPDMTLERLEKLIYKHKKAVVFRIRIKNLHSNELFPPAPYISLSKCKVVGDRLIDNGRIVSAEYIETALTDIDYRIVKNNYNWSEAEVFDVFVASYGYLPNGLVDVVKKYYTLKTELKGISGKEYYYMKSKNKLNAIFGMSAQDPKKDNWIYENGDYKKEIGNIIYTVLPYQFGVWTTALTRYSLRRAIEKVGNDFVYCDTDSVKYIGEYSFDDINDEIMSAAKEKAATAIDKHGVTHFMGIFEQEDTYDKFVTLGAKKYCYIKNGVLGITCSGVSTKKLPEEEQTPEIKTYAAKELKKIENFTEDFIFSLAGKNIVAYHDHKPYYFEVDNHTILITSNAAIMDGEYTISISNQYKEYIQKINTLLK